jgi:hypothetical protein
LFTNSEHRNEMNRWARWVPLFALLREFLIVIGLKGAGLLPEIKGSLGGNRARHRLGGDDRNGDLPELHHARYRKGGVGSADPDPQQLARAIWINEFNYGTADLALMEGMADCPNTGPFARRPDHAVFRQRVRLMTNS